MKKLILISLILISVRAAAQHSIGDPIEFTDTIKTPGLQARDLYNHVVQFFDIGLKTPLSLSYQRNPEGNTVTGAFVYYASEIPISREIDYRLFGLKTNIQAKDGFLVITYYSVYNQVYGYLTSGPWCDKGLGKNMRIQRYDDLQKAAYSRIKDLRLCFYAYFTTLQ